MNLIQIKKRKDLPGGVIITITFFGAFELEIRIKKDDPPILPADHK